MASWGSFDFVNLGDLLWPLEHDLACPVNKLGQVELYQTTHHGQTQSGAPQLIHAMEPLVAVMNNGASKGGAAVQHPQPDLVSRLPGSVAGAPFEQRRRGQHRRRAHRQQRGADQGRWLKATITPMAGSPC